MLCYIGLVLAPPDEAELLVEEEVNHDHASRVAADACPAVGVGEEERVDLALVATPLPAHRFHDRGRGHGLRSEGWP